MQMDIYRQGPYQLSDLALSNISSNGLNPNYVQGQFLQNTAQRVLSGLGSSASIVLDFLPVISGIKGGIEFFSGTDYLTGQPVHRGFAAVGIVAGIVGAKGVLKAFTHGEEVIDLFRAVSKAELDDILDLQKFRPKPGGGSLEPKQFGLNVDETKSFAVKFSDISDVLRVRIPKSTFNKLDLTELDTFIFKSGTATVQPGQLELFNKSIISIEKVFSK